MNAYGGGVLAAATVLPATTASAFLLSGKAPSLVIYGLLAVSVVSLVYLSATAVRYYVNR